VQKFLQGNIEFFSTTQFICDIIFKTMDRALWGIDLGGTKTEGVILPSLDEAKPLLRLRIHTESNKGYDHIVHQVKKLVDQMKQQSGLTPTAIGFGTPGVLDPLNQTMKNCNSTALNGMPLKKHLEEILGVDAVLANDANCFALAETHWGRCEREGAKRKNGFWNYHGNGCWRWHRT
jgi:predicted NBD/HSP70 family sugar kinase